MLNELVWDSINKSPASVPGLSYIGFSSGCLTDRVLEYFLRVFKSPLESLPIPLE